MTAQIGYGASFNRGDGNSPTVYNSIGEVLSINGPGMGRDPVETTHMTSTERWRTFIGGLKDGGEVSLDLNFDPGAAANTSLLSDLNTNTAQDYQVAWSDGSLWTFSALLTAYEPTAPIDDRMTATATFKISGKPYYVG